MQFYKEMGFEPENLVPAFPMWMSALRAELTPHGRLALCVTPGKQAEVLLSKNITNLSLSNVSGGGQL